MLNKTRLCYRVVKGKNPRNGKEILRPVIAKREVCGVHEIVERMMRSGWAGRGASFIRSDIEEIFRIIRELCLEGKVVTIAEWLSLRGDLTGTVKEDHALSKDNEYHLSAKILGRNHIPIDTFSWSDVSHDEAQAKLHIALPDGTEIAYSVTCITGRAGHEVERYGEATATLAS